ncbi:MAG: thiamine pyrophosphate-dependent enzyme, partial [Pseudomonadota bacterium]
WDNSGYGEIKDYMVQNGITPVGVDLHTPDFIGIGRAYGAETARVGSLEALPGLLSAAAERQGPTLLHLPEQVVLG